MKLTTYDGEMEILPEGKIRIQKGKRGAGKIISMKDVLTVIMLKPKFTAAGCVYVQVYGGTEYPSYANITQYGMNPNAICFRKKQLEEAEAFKEALEKEIAEYK